MEQARGHGAGTGTGSRHGDMEKAQGHGAGMGTWSWHGDGEQVQGWGADTGMGSRHEDGEQAQGHGAGMGTGSRHAQLAGTGTASPGWLAGTSGQGEARPSAPSPDLRATSAPQGGDPWSPLNSAQGQAVGHGQIP